MVGLSSSPTAFFSWFLVFWLYVVYFTYFGLLLGCVMANGELATVMAGAFTSLGSLMSGFMLPKDSIPWWWRWLYYLNPMTYAVQALLSSQFYCEAADMDADHPGNCSMFDQQTISGGSNMVAVWKFVKDMFNLDYDDRWLYVCLVVVFIVVCRAGCGLALTFINHAKR
eukprot:GGOE01049057.1.p2 GENE.GGOE01049057.1~~GGOE01049057.1.p2  ORF type:complete len:169 (-),score=61.52 GGOE01049057.1:295-801(-)